MTGREGSPISEVWRFLRERDAEMGKIHDQLEDLAFKEGKLSTKVKLLIAVAVAAAFGVQGGVTNYATRAKNAGASDEEIFEAIRVPSLQGGARAQVTALLGLKEIIGRQ